MTLACTKITVVTLISTTNIHNSNMLHFTLHTIINLVITTWGIHTLSSFADRRVGATVLEHGNRIAMALLGKGESRVPIGTLS